MSKLWPIFIVSLVLAALSDAVSLRDKNTLAYVKKDWGFYAVMALLMIVFVGLRTRYNDTSTYIHSYNLDSAAKKTFSDLDSSIGANVGYNFLNICLISLGVSTQGYLMFYAAVTIGIYLWFLRKYSDNLWLSVFLFFAIGSYTFTMAAIKQCVAVAFCLVAVDRAIQKKWIPFLLWTLLAVTFHPYSFMYLIVPFLLFKPWKKKTYCLIVLFLALGFLLQPLLGTLVSITSMIGEEYDVHSFSGEGVNIFRLAVCWVPVVLSFLVRKQIWAEDDSVQELFLNLTMLNATIMFVALFGTANYFARLANYFLIFSCLSIPWLLSKFQTKDRQYLTAAAVVCYLLYFYYANGVNQPFDQLFSKTTLRQYIALLIGK